MKVAPIHDRMRRTKCIQPYLIHTGQHYDDRMSDSFFRQLGLPQPDRYLGVGSGGHGEQTGRIMVAFEGVVRELKPDMVVVVGDVNSTIACGLVAVKLGVQLVHVEAGLRSFDRTMPEEINRVLTDQISDFLFTSEESALQNLKREGISESRVHFVGNVMIDSLLKHREKVVDRPILSDLGLMAGEFILVTLHRPANVDEQASLRGLVDTLGRLSETLPVLFPMHPRTRKQIDEFGLTQLIGRYHRLRLVEPLGYLDFLRCMDTARLVITDSGGVQEETTVLGVPCLTARENTERPITVTVGTNKVIGRDPQRLYDETMLVLRNGGKKGKCPPLWDGAASDRIVQFLSQA